MRDESVTELQRRELLDSAQCEAGVPIVAGGFCRHSLSFRAAIREFGVMKVHRFAPSLDVARFVGPYIHEGHKLVAVMRDGM
eukprot:924332-Pleurochrysis_carterae.AAC.1